MGRDLKDVFKYWMFKDMHLIGEFGFPLIYPANDVPSNIISFNYINSMLKKNNFNPKEYFVHFFIDDYQFERVWNNPKTYVEIFRKFGGIIMPDFSVYTNFPKALQIYNVYRSRVLAAYYQRLGIQVIPNVTWSDEESLEWVLDGLPKYSVLALSSNGCLNRDVIDNFVSLYYKCMDQLNPKKVLIVGKTPKELKNDSRIIEFPGHLQRMEKRL